MGLANGLTLPRGDSGEEERMAGEEIRCGTELGMGGRGERRTGAEAGLSAWVNEASRAKLIGEASIDVLMRRYD